MIFKSYSFTVFIFLTLGLCVHQVEAQAVSGVLRDKKTDETIPFADIKTGDKYGAITNKQGEFNIQTKNLKATDSVVFSSMGFQRKSIALKDLDQETVYLSPEINRLDDVYLMDKKPDPREILEKVREKADENYASTYQKYSIFKRKSETARPKKLELDFKRVSFLSRKKRKHFNQKLEEVAANSDITSHIYKDSYVNLYQGDAGEFKLKQNLATELSNPDKQVSTNGLVHRVFNLIGDKLKSAKTFKVRSGIFPLEDSWDIQEYIKEKDSLKTDERKKDFVALFQKYNLSTGPHFEFITKPTDYAYTLEGLTNYNEELVYAISFRPRTGDAKFKGKLHVSTSSFAVLKLTYELTEEESTPGIIKFFLGIKHETNAKSGMAVYRKNAEGTYASRYISVSGRERFYLNRRLALIENSDKSSRIKVKAKIHVDIHQGNDEQYLFVKSENISESDYADFSESSGITIEHIQKYDPQIWEEYNIIAPDEAIRNFEY